MLSKAISKKTPTSRATVKETHRNSVRRRGRQKRLRKSRSVRFSSLGHSQRMLFSTLPFHEGNDKLSSWKSLFFYRCTDEILFAPLKSQGVDSRLKYIREKTVEAAPPPCSPKSIYVLANLVRQPSSKHLAHVTDIYFSSKLSPSAIPL